MEKLSGGTRIEIPAATTPTALAAFEAAANRILNSVDWTQMPYVPTEEEEEIERLRAENAKLRARLAVQKMSEPKEKAHAEAMETTDGTTNEARGSRVTGGV